MATFKAVDFLTVRLDQSDKGAFDTWASDNQDDIMTHLSQTCDAGYKISMSYDFENSTYIVALTGKKDTPVNAHKCFTSRSSDMIDAVQLMLYKHWVLADNGDWSKIATALNNWG